MLMSSVVTCRQLKSLSLQSVNFKQRHKDLKVLLDKLPQLITMEMRLCEYEHGDINASVNVSFGIHTSVKKVGLDLRHKNQDIVIMGCP